MDKSRLIEKLMEFSTDMAEKEYHRQHPSFSPYRQGIMDGLFSVLVKSNIIGENSEGKLIFEDVELK